MYSARLDPIIPSLNSEKYKVYVIPENGSICSHVNKGLTHHASPQIFFLPLIKFVLVLIML